MRNHYEMIQWTLAVELRASFLLYLALNVTAEFRRFHRNLVFFVILAFCIYGGDLMGEIPFFTGALFADMSLHINQHDQVSATPPQSYIRRYWPVILAVFGLLLASYPTNHAELAGWSRAMTSIGQRLFHRNCCLFLRFMLMHRGTEMGLGYLGRHATDLLTPLLSQPSETFLKSICRCVWQTMLSGVSHSLILHVNGAGLDDLWAWSALRSPSHCRLRV